MQNLIIWFQTNTANFLREWQIGSFAAQAAMLIIGFAIYFKKGIKSSEILSLRTFYYRLAFFFFILSFSIFFNISGIYYSSSPEVSYMKTTLAIGIGLAGITLLLQNLERLEIIKTNKVISLISFGVTVLTFILGLIPKNIMAPILALPIWFLTPFIFFHISFREKGKIRVKSFFLGLGFLLFFSGLIVIPDILNNLIPNILISSDSIFFYYYNYFSFGMVYIGLIMLLSFGSINFFIQGKWTEKINSIYITLKNGDNIIHKIFKTDEKTTQLTEEGQNLIKLYIQNSNKSDKPIKIIEKEDKVLFFEEGIHVITLLVTSENQKIFENKLKEFLRDFELLYGEFLVNWDGNLAVFESAYAFIDGHFQAGGI